ncbi:hypothetical protein QTP70_018475 [Hemibagrus guttatus]|uniref:Endonuclease/exonuclease/phosphatase domain-containing protein n=1 Tax=Hemibagrus guttatus TaxID=175788 RepID=A0AAE0RCP8_9TELE|nr:hypothetical protein QTP70_018475 [Hemibagrus guttatus]
MPPHFRRQRMFPARPSSSSSSPGLAPPLSPRGTALHFRFSVEDVASLLIGGGDHRPHLPPLGGFRPSRAEVVARLCCSAGDVTRLCCSAVDVARLCCSAVDVARLCCLAVDVARLSCSAVDIARRFCSAVDVVWDPLALPPYPSLPPLASPCSSLPPLTSPCSSLPSPASPCSSLPPLVASPCASLLSGFYWTKNSSGLWGGVGASGAAPYGVGGGVACQYSGEGVRCDWVGCELEEKEGFWSELDEVIESIPTGERVVIGADFNGHVGEGNRGDEVVMGKFGVKERNLEGRMVVDFAKRMDMAVVNTYFQKREEHRVTYKSVGRKVLGVSSGRRKDDKETWWWNEEVQDSIQRKRLAKKKWDMDRTEENRQEYKELRRRVKREVPKAKQKAYDELYNRLDTKEGEKNLYRLARQRD